tara:strand:- start:291 stop:539 length:249 start_codon:yes stop_codon:yes gene_type:complete
MTAQHTAKAVIRNKRMRDRQKVEGCRRIDSTLDPVRSAKFAALLNARKACDDTAKPKDVLQDLVDLAYREQFGEMGQAEIQQ